MQSVVPGNKEEWWVANHKTNCFVATFQLEITVVVVAVETTAGIYWSFERRCVSPLSLLKYETSVRTNILCYLLNDTRLSWLVTKFDKSWKHIIFTARCRTNRTFHTVCNNGKKSSRQCKRSCMHCAHVGSVGTRNALSHRRHKTCNNRPYRPVTSINYLLENVWEDFKLISDTK